jgi:CBS domain/Peptidase family M50
MDSAKVWLVDRLAAVNLFLVLFNMIPAFPMDGGRVLRALLATRMGYVRATEVAAMIGQGVAFVLGFVGLFYNPMMIFIAIFVYLAAASEAHMVGMRGISRGVPVSSAMMTQFATLAPDAPIEDAVQKLLHTNQSEFPVVNAAGKLVGLLSRSDLVRILNQRDPNARVADAMTTMIPTIGYRRRLEERPLS